MAVVPRRQPSALVSTGLSAATVALNVAGAATDAVPIAKQILNSAAHICAAAERIQKKREAMYTLVEKSDIYATQINIAVAGRVLNTSLQRRLERLYSVFLKIEALVDIKAGSKNNALTRVWQSVVAKPNRAETLVAELEREIQLFQLLTEIQLSLVADHTACAIDDTATAVAADAKYDGQFRILRDCDIEKLDVITTRETDEGVVVWASARVKRQLMVIRYLESQPHAKANTVTTLNGSTESWDVYIEHMKKVSTVYGSHPHIVQLYGRHVQGPGAVFKAGTFLMDSYLWTLGAVEGNTDDTAVKRLRLAYQILDASAHLTDVHGLMWDGINAMVDENGEPRIGLFDDIVRAGPDQLPNAVPISIAILIWYSHRTSEETGVVEQVHDSSLHAIIKEQLRDGNNTDRLQRVWDIIRREQLYVQSNKSTFPITANLSLSQKLIARARLYFETRTEEESNSLYFLRHVVIGRGANISSRVRIYITPGQVNSEFEIEVEAYSRDESHIHYHRFYIDIPAGSPLLAAVARAAGLPDDFEHSRNYLIIDIYPETRNRDQGRFDESHTGSGSEEEDENYETADEGDASFRQEKGKCDVDMIGYSKDT
ncbi:hypothetical protein EXIGLDRAFT_731371 [Exidia glandulosa HHB12029]|uniref:Uncharacterized protein n=1 Tax=Exidia glandulosa HHB12029 TaxID=1314781 RepID=A0A165BWR8_EXIGL|nr:hypothetical protein EXIGLDRAFT_731371 [Exidia glandulosa HHB12029]